jgi:hypothetical protein
VHGARDNKGFYVTVIYNLLPIIHRSFLKNIDWFTIPSRACCRVNSNMVQGEISPLVLNEVSRKQETQLDVEMINGEDNQEINLELDTTDGLTTKKYSR